MQTNPLLEQTVNRFWDTIPRVWNCVRANARANAVQRFNLSLLQFHVLRQVWRGAGSIAELADRQQASRPAISNTVDQLVDKGLVTRRQDETDRRYVQVALTEKGQELIHAIFARNHAWMSEKMAGLNTDELDTLVRAMDILKNVFEDQKSESSFK